jgi:hypothetical protein
VRRLGLTALLAGALAFAPSASAGVKNACKLVTAADVSSALKGKVGAGAHEKVGAFNACLYKLGKVSVTVKTRLLSQAGHRAVVKSIPGLALKATDVSPNAWVYFPTNGTSLDDWKHGSEIEFVVLGAGPDAVLILKQLAKNARSRL